MNPKEPEFAQKRRRLQKEILAFVEGYVQEAGVKLTGSGSRLAGTVDPKTLADHDVALDWGFEDLQEPAHTEELGVRIRHEQWEPKVTVWSTRSIMESFSCDRLTDEVKNKLMDCIDKTITQT